MEPSRRHCICSSLAWLLGQIAAVPKPAGRVLRRDLLERRDAGGSQRRAGPCSPSPPPGFPLGARRLARRQIRRGGGQAQPLTAARFDGWASSFSFLPAHVLQHPPWPGLRLGASPAATAVSKARGAPAPSRMKGAWTPARGRPALRGSVCPRSALPPPRPGAHAALAHRAG